MKDLVTIQHAIDKFFPGLLGIRIKELALDRVVAEMEVRPDLCTGDGILHGGAYMAFADTLGGIGTFYNLEQGKRTITTDSNTKFIAAARIHSKVIGESIAVHRGRTTMVWQTTIRNEEGKLCALVTQTQLVTEDK